MRKLSVPMMIALIAAGCTTHLETRPVADNHDGAINGIPYWLPALEYEMAIVRTLTSCSEMAGTDMEPQFNVEVVAVPRYVAGEMFVADYGQLSSWTKTATLGIESYPNRTLKSINVAARDESPEIIAGVAKAALTVARISTGVVAGLGLDPRTQLPNPCPDELGLVKQWQVAVKRLGREMKALNLRLERYRVPLALGTVSDADKVEITRLSTQIADKSATMLSLQDSIAEQMKALSFSESVTLRPTAERAGKMLRFPSENLETGKRQTEWVNGLFDGKLDPEKFAELSLKMSLVATVEGAADSGPAGKAADTSVVVKGLTFRTPRVMKLLICSGNDAHACSTGQQKPLLAGEVSAPQFGPLVTLPFNNGFGENNQLKASFRADGTLDKAEYGSPEGSVSQGKAVMAGVNDVLAQGLQFEQARLAKKQADKEEASSRASDALDQQIAVAKKQKELLVLQTAMDPDNLAAERELAALQAEIARLQALKTIRELGET